MKKKILVPFMFFVFTIMAGVNYKMLNQNTNEKLNLASFVKMAFANSETAPGGEQDSTSLQLYETKDANGNVTDVDCSSSGIGC